MRAPKMQIWGKLLRRSFHFRESFGSVTQQFCKLNLFRGERGGGESLAHSRAGGIVKKCEKKCSRTSNFESDDFRVEFPHQKAPEWKFLIGKLLSTKLKTFKPSRSPDEHVLLDEEFRFTSTDQQGEFNSGIRFAFLKPFHSVIYAKLFPTRTIPNKVNC